MFGQVLQGVDTVERKALIIKQVMRQIITSLKKIHDTGIVHRDVKPANLVVTKRGQIKLIDFGAATDLRIGKNYVPNRGLLDPDYCPPELFVLPKETPSPPPEPIAALLSPVLWQVLYLVQSKKPLAVPFEELYKYGKKEERILMTSDLH